MARRLIAFVQFTPAGGLFQFSAQLGHALASYGHDVHLITGRRPELVSQHPGFIIHTPLPIWHMDTTGHGTTVRRLCRWMQGACLALAWLPLLRRLRRMQPEVVLWSKWSFSVDAVGVLLTSWLFPRSVLGIIAHEPRVMRKTDTNSYKSGLVLDRALLAAWRRMDVVFVLGEQTRTRVLENCKPRCPVIVIPHGDETALRDGLPVFPVAKTGPVVLFFGTWTAYKGISVLLDSLPEVRRSVPNARVVLAGRVAEVDRSLLRRAEHLDGVRTRPGYVPIKEIPELFDEARVVVAPYLRASQSGVVHLAYTFGRPVVATAVGDIPAVVRDGETGLLVARGDPSALAKALISLLADPEYAARLGTAGGRWLAEQASWERVAQQVDAGLAASAATK